MTDAGGFGPQQKEGELGRDFVSEVKGRIYGVHASCMASSQSSFCNVAGPLKWVHGLAKLEHSIGFRRSGRISPFSQRHVVPLFSI